MARKPALSLTGFDDLLARIERAGGTIDQAADACAREAARVQQSHLRAQMQRKKASSSLVSRLPEPEIERDGNVWRVRVGYKKGAYDPKDLSDGYKAVFLNYGTPRVKPRKFVEAAKRRARPEIKEAEERALSDMLRGLEG